MNKTRLSKSIWPSLKLTVRIWQLMVGRRNLSSYNGSFPGGELIHLKNVHPQKLPVTMKNPTISQQKYLSKKNGWFFHLPCSSFLGWGPVVFKNWGGAIGYFLMGNPSPTLDRWGIALASSVTWPKQARQRFPVAGHGNGWKWNWNWISIYI